LVKTDFFLSNRKIKVLSSVFLVDNTFVMRMRTNVDHSLRFPQTGLAKLASPYCLSLVVKASLVNSSLAPFGRV